MEKSDETYLRGGSGSFPPTNWQVLSAGRSGDGQRRAEAMATLVDLYRRPIYHYLRCRGYGPADAQDLTQGFLADRLLEGHVVEQAQPEKGHFRWFLLACLRNYVSNLRRGHKGFFEPDNRVARSAEDVLADKATAGMSPERAFDYVWTRQFLDRVILDVEQECSRGGHQVHWEAFRRSLLEPLLFGASRPRHDELGRDLGLRDGKAVSNHVETVKRRFRKRLREALWSPGMSDQDVDREIKAMIASSLGGVGIERA